MPNLSQMFDLTGRTAVVTGGAGLLGAEFCRTLASAGARVVVADLDGSAASALAASLQEAGFQAQGVQVDVTSPASVQAMVGETLAAFGGLHILVNSAALDPKFDPVRRDGAPDDPGAPAHTLTFENYPLELWNQALSVNLTGLFLCCQTAAGPLLESGKGAIVNLCSMYGLVGPDQRLYARQGQPPQFKPAHYSVTKAGVLGLTRYLAAYYAGKNLRVNALTPGGVFNGHDDEFLQAYSARAILGRMAEKDEMNGALLFLASDASSYMTGANLVVDGGWTAW